MCPYYLDGDRTRNGSVIPVVDAIAIARDRCGYCAVFKDRRRRTLAVSGAVSRQARRAPGSRRSLKAQQHAGVADPAPQEERGRRRLAGQVRSTC